MTASRRRLPAKSAPRTYASIEDLLHGEGLGEQVRKAYAQLVQDTCVTDGLTRLRRRSKLTQTDIAKQLGVTQAAVSKVESGRDETLTLAIISAYARTSRQRINLSFGQPMTHVEAVKEHALGLRHHLEALASLAHKDEVIAKDVEGFLRKAAVNIDQIIAHCRERLPKQRKVEVRMQTLVSPTTNLRRDLASR
jgi:transcriptional regulator with XRE-family HTH domain